MKETISIARATLEKNTVAQFGKKIQLNLGPREVAVLKAVHSTVNPVVANQSMTYGLYRKGDKIDSNIESHDEVVEDNNWIMRNEVDLGVAGYLGPVLSNSYMLMPADLVLLGSPQLVIRPNQASTMRVIMAIYYEIRTVNESDLARLMMKYRSK